MKLSEMFKPWEIDPCMVPAREWDEEGLLIMSGTYDIKSGRELSRYEVRTGYRIIWTYYDDGTIVW